MKKVLCCGLSTIGLLLSISSVESAPLPAGRPKELVSFKAHTHNVWGIAFSPDGKTLATAGCGDGTAKLWDAVSGKHLATFKGHEAVRHINAWGYVLAVAFSPDGKTLATGGDDWTVRLWDIGSGKCTSVLKQRSACVTLLFSPDGKSLAVRGPVLWDLEKKQARPIFKGITGGHPVMAYDAKGKLVAATASAYPEPPPPSFSLWDAESGAKLVTFRGHTKEVGCVAFSSDRRMIASSSHDHTVRLWDAATGKSIATFPEMKDMPCDVRFSPDDKVLAVSSTPGFDRNDYPGTIRLFSVPDGKLLATLKGRDISFHHMAFSPDGRLLASGGYPTVKIWSLPSRYKSAE